MIKISSSSVSPEAVHTGSAATAVPASKAAAEPRIVDQVELSESASVAPEDRSKKIASLKADVASGSYSPQSVPVIRKLVAGALSRTD